MSLMDLLRRRRPRSFANQMSDASLPMGSAEPLDLSQEDLLAALGLESELETGSPDLESSAGPLAGLAGLMGSASMDRPSVRDAVLTKPSRVDPSRFELTDFEKALTQQKPDLLASVRGRARNAQGVPRMVGTGPQRGSGLDALYARMAQSKGGSVLSQPLDKQRLGGLTAAQSAIEMMGLVGAGSALAGANALAAPMADAAIPAGTRLFAAARAPEALERLRRAQEFFQRYKQILGNKSIDPRTVGRWQGSQSVQDALRRALEIMGEVQ